MTDPDRLPTGPLLPGEPTSERVPLYRLLGLILTLAGDLLVIDALFEP